MYHLEHFLVNNAEALSTFTLLCSHLHHLLSELYCYPKLKLCTYKAITSHSCSPNLRQPGNPFSFLIPHVSTLLQYLSFCVCFVSLCIMFSRSMHVVA